MSRRSSKKRRLDRKTRPKRTIAPAPHEWGQGPELTPEERSRVVQRFASLSHRGTTFGFVPMTPWVDARTPEELNDAVRTELEERSAGKLSN